MPSNAAFPLRALARTSLPMRRWSAALMSCYIYLRNLFDISTLDLFGFKPPNARLRLGQSPVDYQ